jgi:hypothetical protein
LKKKGSWLGSLASTLQLLSPSFDLRQKRKGNSRLAPGSANLADSKQIESKEIPANPYFEQFDKTGDSPNGPCQT